MFSFVSSLLQNRLLRLDVFSILQPIVSERGLTFYVIEARFDIIDAERVHYNQGGFPW